MPPFALTSAPANWHRPSRFVYLPYVLHRPSDYANHRRVITRLSFKRIYLIRWKRFARKSIIPYEGSPLSTNFPTSLKSIGNLGELLVDFKSLRSYDFWYNHYGERSKHFIWELNFGRVPDTPKTSSNCRGLGSSGEDLEGGLRDASR